MKIHLIGNSSLQKNVPKNDVDFTAIEDFYDGDRFWMARKNIMLDHSFREGLFLKSLERFFVLEQFMQMNKMESIFHAELDQLLFRTDQLVNNLDNTKRHGIFIPFHTSDTAVASVFYCNNQESLLSLLEFSCSGGEYPHEMALISNWAAKNRNEVFALPTLASLISNKKRISSLPIDVLQASEVGGIVDAAQIGQWIGGIDPRNVPIGVVPRTKFVDKADEMLLSREQLIMTRFRINKDSGNLVCNYDGPSAVNLYNLHLHSKIHSSLVKPYSKLEELFWSANKDFSTVLPGTRKVQLLNYFSSQVLYLMNNPKKVTNGILSRLYQRKKKL